jgi:hypothetical protein
VDEEALKADIARIGDELGSKGRHDLVREMADYELTLEDAVLPGARKDKLEALRNVADADANPFPNPTIDMKLTALELASAAVGNELFDIAQRIKGLVRGAWPITHPDATA